jgi:putative thiamine transport system permease protein
VAAALRLVSPPADLAAARPRRGPDLIVAVPALTLALFLAPVLAGMLGTWLPAFGWLPALGGRSFTLEPWRMLLAAPELPAALRLTLTSGLLASLLSFLIAVGFCAGCHGTRFYRAVEQLLAPLLAIPHAAVAIGLAFLIAPSGWLARLLSPWATGWQLPPDIATVQDPLGLALAAGLVVKEVPYLLVMILAASSQVEAAQSLTVARSLGYRPATAWLKAVFPRIYPQIRLPVYAVLAYSLSTVDMALILAPGTPPPLAPLLLRWFNDPDLTMRFIAAAGATLQLILVILAILLWRAGERLVGGLFRRALADGGRAQGGPAIRLASGGAMLLLLLAAAGALAGILLWSIAERWRFPAALPTQWSLAAWLRQAHALGAPAWTTLSIGVAVAAAALALALGCLENEQRHGLHPTNRALWLIYAPLILPQMSFLFGLQVLLVTIGLDGSWIGLAWSHLLFVLPYVFLSLADPFRTLDERYARSALCLGARPNRVFWRIKLPMLLRPVLVAFAVGFAVSNAQYLPTLFAGAGRFSSLTTEAVSLAAGADRRVIAIYVFAQSILPLVPFALALLLSRRRRNGAAGLNAMMDTRHG